MEFEEIFCSLAELSNCGGAGMTQEMEQLAELSAKKDQMTLEGVDRRGMLQEADSYVIKGSRENHKGSTSWSGVLRHNEAVSLGHEQQSAPATTTSTWFFIFFLFFLRRRNGWMLGFRLHTPWRKNCCAGFDRDKRQGSRTPGW